ncbi:MAG: mechanosensitive ion channel family protein [Phycisphaerales bacterium JB038]
MQSTHNTRFTTGPWRCWLLLALLLFAPRVALAQEGTDAAAAPPVAAAYESPQATAQTFLEAMNPATPGLPRDLARAASCLELSEISQEAHAEHARMLYGILNRIDLIDIAALPDARQVERRQLTSHTLFPREGSAPDLRNSVYLAYPQGKIVFEKQAGGEWKFSRDTVLSIRDFYTHVEHLELKAGEDETAGSFALWLRGHMPLFLRQNSFLSLEYGQWLCIGIIIIIGVAIDHLVRFLVLILSRHLVKRKGGEAETATWQRMVRPFGWFAAALLWFWAVQVLLLPDAALRILLLAARLFMMLSAVWAGYRVTDLIGEVLARKASETTTKFDDVLVPLLRKALKIIITVFGLIYIADSMNIEIAPLLAGLGIGGLGFAFAAKDTIENFFGSVTVVADRPFEVGDWIVIGDTEGTVEELGLRSTRVRTFYNSLVTVPNATLVRAVVDNYGKRKYRRAKTHIGIQYDTPPDKIDAFCEGIRELVRVHPYTRKDYYQVWFHQFGPSSLDILLYVFHEVPDWQTELRERHRLFLDIMRLADRLGVQFAFPTQTLHVFQEEAGAEHLPADLPGDGADVAAKRQGRRLAHEITKSADWRRRKPGPYVFTGPSTGDDDDETQIESKAGGDA